MKCSRCQRELKEGEALEKDGLILCEDCYMKEEERKNYCCCNPFSLRSAKLFKAQAKAKPDVGPGSCCQP